MKRTIILQTIIFTMFCGIVSSFGQQPVSEPISVESVSDNPESTIPKNSAEREWLVLVYMSGANDLGILGYIDKNINAMESINFTNKVLVVTKYNGIRSEENKQLQFQGDSEKLHIRHDSDINKITSPAFYSKYNSDMGDQKHLCRFVISNMLRFPAKITMLIIWGHGGWH